MCSSGQRLICIPTIHQPCHGGPKNGRIVALGGISHGETETVSCAILRVHNLHMPFSRKFRRFQLARPNITAIILTHLPCFVCCFGLSQRHKPPGMPATASRAEAAERMAMQKTSLSSKKVVFQFQGGLLLVFSHNSTCMAERSRQLSGTQVSFTQNPSPIFSKEAPSFPGWVLLGGGCLWFPPKS